MARMLAIEKGLGVSIMHTGAGSKRNGVPACSVGPLAVPDLAKDCRRARESGRLAAALFSYRSQAGGLRAGYLGHNYAVLRRRR